MAENSEYARRNRAMSIVQARMELQMKKDESIKPAKIRVEKLSTIFSNSL